MNVMYCLPKELSLSRRVIGSDDEVRGRRWPLLTCKSFFLLVFVAVASTAFLYVAPAVEWDQLLRVAVHCFMRPPIHSASRRRVLLEGHVNRICTPHTRSRPPRLRMANRLPSSFCTVVEKCPQTHRSHKRQHRWWS